MNSSMNCGRERRHAVLTFSSSFLPVATRGACASSTCTTAPLRKPRRSSSSPTRQLPTAVQQVPPTTTSPPPPSSKPSATTTSAPPSAPKWLLGYLKANKQHVDDALETCLDSETNDRTSTITSSMRYSLLAGGKRIRPILSIAAFELFSSNVSTRSTNPIERLDPIMPTALAVEMIHTMSLIHDDLPAMDNDDFRRGKPTNHKVYGEDMAILSGDALLAYAFETVALHTPKYSNEKLDYKRIVNVLKLLAESVGPNGLAGGQAMDLECENSSTVSLDDLTWIHMHKTAVLLRVSCACGAIIGGADDDDVKRVSEFATKVGLAFQIADDVLDVTQSTEVLGKTAGKDVAAGKATFPRLLGLEASRLQAERLIKEAKEALLPYGDRAKTLIALADFIINRQN